jgi:hypothetical protein
VARNIAETTQAVTKNASHLLFIMWQFKQGKAMSTHRDQEFITVSDSLSGWSASC